jgi:TolB-like protein/Tfp pilus assembly protein PilF
MTPPIVRFDGFEVDLRTRELRRGAERIHLQDQPFHILSMLLEHPGDVVTRDAIRARLWPDGTFVDFEHSVNAAIKRLRTALGDTAENPRFVETMPRRGYRFVAPIDDSVHAIAAAMPRQILSSRRKPRLVVLPFTNLTEGAPDYFSDGMTEEMIAQLGRRCADHIGVLARTSSMLYKNVVRAASEIGEALCADYLVEGSVRRDGDRVRITAQLIETRGETHVWADSYDRDLSDCLAVQAEVASQIAQALMLELLPSQTSASLTRHPAAYQAFLRGRYQWNRQGEQGLLEAIHFYDQALGLDPQFGKAYSARARARVSLCEYYVSEPRLELARAREDALRALSFDASDAEAHLAIGEVRRTLDWDWVSAEAAYRTALAANPNSDATLRHYAVFLAARGRREAMETADRARSLDPLCLTVHTAAASVRYFAGAYDDAAQHYRDTLAIDPSFVTARRGLAATLVQLKAFDEAIATLRAVSDDTRDPVSDAWLGHALAVSGDMAAAQVVLSRLQRRKQGRPVPPYHMAMLFTGFGQKDAAFESLRAACDARDPMLDTLQVEPRFEPLRVYPQYASIVERLRLHGPLPVRT